MGIPYSKQINAAFDEVTPLVAAGFRVLRTTRNVTILLAVIAALSVLLLALAVIILIGILITVSPDLETERRILVTPTVKWLASWLIDRSWLRVIVWTALVGGALGGLAGLYVPPYVDVLEEGEEDASVGDAGSQGDHEF